MNLDFNHDLQRYGVLLSSYRLGSSLEGAYLIWDAFLTNIAAQLNAFLPAFVRALLVSLTEYSANDPKGDVDKEALMMWLHHVLYSNEFYAQGPSFDHSLSVDAMRWCCLYPQYWTNRLGRELLSSDDSLQVDWKDMFEASGLKHTAESIGSSIQRSERSPQFDEIGANVQKDLVASQAVNPEARGWIRAVTPVTAPIGVVR